ncbi:hypothetical protein CDIK_1966 [Cucumispora dikerogammari]|nr:hypothetical protein CDIK_1966 [Cucumispora dikerogammari]
MENNTSISKITIYILNNIVKIFLIIITFLNIFFFTFKRDLIRHGYIYNKYYKYSNDKNISKYFVNKRISKNNFYFFYLTGIIIYIFKILLVFSYKKVNINFLNLKELYLFKQLIFMCNNYWYLIHLIRRFIESRFIFSYSYNSTMSIGHLLLGVSYYIFISLYFSTLPGLYRMQMVVYIIIQVLCFISHLLVFSCVNVECLRVVKWKIIKWLDGEKQKERNKILYRMPYIFEILNYGCVCLWFGNSLYCKEGVCKSVVRVELWLNLVWVVSVFVVNLFSC